jgi:hypothetical protein
MEAEAAKERMAETFELITFKIERRKDNVCMHADCLVTLALPSSSIKTTNGNNSSSGSSSSCSQGVGVATDSMAGS